MMCYSLNSSAQEEIDGDYHASHIYMTDLQPLK